MDGAEAAKPRAKVVGGQEEAYAQLREMIELPIKHPEHFRNVGVEPPGGVLLFGPPRNGKTLLAKTVAEQAGAHFEVINGAQVTEKELGEVFARAQQHKPAVILLDEVDALGGGRDQGGEATRRMTTLLLTLLDGAQKRDGVVVVATSNRPDSIDPALRQPGRFEREIEVKAPNEKGREEILGVHTQKMALAPGINLKAIAKKTSGMSGGDLAALTREAGMLAVRRVAASMADEADKTSQRLASVGIAHGDAAYKFSQYKEELATHDNPNAPELSFDEFAQILGDAKKQSPRPDFSRPWRISPSANHIAELGFEDTDGEGWTWRVRDFRAASKRRPIASNQVTQKDFETALEKAKPATTRQFQVETPKLSWDDVAGLEDAKAQMREVIERPHGDGFERFRVEVPHGILMFGPPGNGKTLLAKVVASKAGRNFISVTASDLVTKWFGQSTNNVAALFARARDSAPTVLFIDEFDAIGAKRGGDADDYGNQENNRIVAQLLQEMNELAKHDVTVIVATNRPDAIDPALIRPDRLGAHIYVGLPELAARRQALEIYTRDRPLAKNVDLGALAKKTEYFSGADLKDLCNKVARMAALEDAKAITNQHFAKALASSAPSVTPEQRAEYARLAKIYGGNAQ